MKKLISIVVPAFNEELVVPELTKRIKAVIDKLKYNFEIIVVENGSTDNTLQELLKQRKLDNRIKIIQLSKNVGCDGGIIAGLKYVKGNAAIIMMADLQDAPELIPIFIKKWEKGYEIIYGIVIKRQGMSVIRKFTTFLFYKVLNIVSRGAIPENVSDFRLIDKKVYMVVNAMPEHNKFVRGIVTWTGFKQIGIPFVRPKRFAGESKAYLSTIIKTALNGITSFSMISYILPWFFSFICLGIGIIFFINKNMTYTTVSLMFSFILLSLGVMSEHLKRILDEVRNRPQFIVKNKYGL